MKKLRYGRRRPKVLTPYEQMLENMKNGVLINEFTELAEKVSTEKEARELARKAIGKKNINPNVFRKVVEILKKRGLLCG